MTASLTRILYIEREGRPARMIARDDTGQVMLLQQNETGEFVLRHGPVEIRKEIADAERLAKVYDQFKGALRKEISLSLALIALAKDPSLVGAVDPADERPAAPDAPAHQVRVTAPPVASSNDAQPAMRP